MGRVKVKYILKTNNVAIYEIISVKALADDKDNKHIKQYEYK